MERQPGAQARRDGRRAVGAAARWGEGRARGAIHLTVNEIAEHLKLNPQTVLRLAPQCGRLGVARWSEHPSGTGFG